MSTNPHQFKRRGRYEFSYLEKEEMREKLPAMAVDVSQKKAEAQTLKDQVKKLDLAIKHGDNEIAATSKKVEDGYEMRDVQCLRFKSYKKKQWIFINLETWEVVDSLDFEKGDAQKGIGELVYPPDNGQAVSDFMLSQTFKDMGITVTLSGNAKSRARKWGKASERRKNSTQIED